MVFDPHVVTLSRWQFAFTAMFHFLFVPLTLGMTWMLVVMEGAYLKTGKIVYKDMTRFWGKLLAINFAIGVISGITMEFEFGLNWAYFSRMIGGSFGPILAIEGITAFMLEATMFGLFFFTWDKLSKTAHFIVTVFLAFGASLSIVNILAANSWMQHPIATTLNYHNMTYQLHSLLALYINSLAQVRIGHVAFAGFLLSSIFVMGISAYYLLHNRDVGFAKRSFAAGVGFGFICMIMVMFFGDQNGLDVAKHEPEKMAAMEGQWTTQKAPAAWYLVAFPDQAKEKNYFTIKIPYGLSIIATHSLDGTVEGLKPIMKRYETNIENGVKAYTALERLQHKVASKEDLATFEKYQDDIGFAYLLKPYTNDIAHATPAEIKKATKNAIPNVATSFWTFRLMIGMWGIMVILIVLGLIFAKRDTLQKHRWYLKAILFAIPVPYIAAEAGWVLAETGRQPWIIHNFLPTFMGISSLTLSSLITSFVLFVIFYATLIGIELFLMFTFARKGPSTLGTGRYHFERQQ